VPGGNQRQSKRWRVVLHPILRTEAGPAQERPISVCPLLGERVADEGGRVRGHFLASRSARDLSKEPWAPPPIKQPISPQHIQRGSVVVGERTWWDTHDYQMTAQQPLPRLGSAVVPSPALVPRAPSPARGARGGLTLSASCVPQLPVCESGAVSRQEMWDMPSPAGERGNRVAVSEGSSAYLKPAIQLQERPDCFARSDSVTLQEWLR
jgi:hypothetical protein